MMLERYFQYQADLGATERNMLCPEDCDAPGCWMTEVVVGVSLFDLIRLSLALNTPVSSLFLNHCRFGFQCNELNPRYVNLWIKLEKPCPFLQKARCRVHSFKPFDCVFFPEYHQIAGVLPELANRPVFKKFPCLKSKITVSDQRSQALKELKKISTREEALSCYFLLEIPSFIIDTKPLVKQLKKSGLKNKSFSAENYHRQLYEKLKSTGLFDGITDKVTRLDTRQEMESLLGQLENKTLIKALLEKKARPEIVFRVDENRLKPVKRYLQRPDLIFM
jgi:Fe-S-cluster containining protein